MPDLKISELTQDSTPATTDQIVVERSGASNFRCTLGEVATAIGATSTPADDVFRIVDNADSTKKLAFEVSAITTATTRTITVPDSALDLGKMVTSAAVITDNAIVRGDSGARGTQASGLICDDSDNVIGFGSIRLKEVSAPSNVANTGFIYALDDGGDTELCWLDDGGAAAQITRDGYVNTNRGVRALGTSTFSINGADDGVSCQWTGTSTGVAGTIDQGRTGQVTPITLTGTAGTITFAAGSGVTLEAARGKTLTTNAPGASTAVHVAIMYHSATFATIVGDLA